MPSGVYPRTAKHRAANKEAQNRPEVKAKRSASEKIAQNKPEVKARRNASIKKYYEEHPEVRVEKRDRMLGDKNPAKRPEVRVKIKVNHPANNERRGEWVACIARAKTGRPRLDMLGDKNPSKHPEVRKKHSTSAIRQWADPEQRESLIKAIHQPEVRKKCRTKALKRWKDPVYKEKQLKAIFAGLKLLPNKPEKFLNKLFQQLFPNQIKYIGDGKDEDSIVAGKCPDFIFADGQKKIIEFFGDYHHGEKRTGVPNEIHERERINHFAQKGYQTLIIWEHELEDIEKLTERIIKFAWLDFKKRKYKCL